MTAPAHDDLTAVVADLTARLARLEALLPDALAVNAGRRDAAPDYAASMDAGLTEPFADYDARLALNAKVAAAAQPVAQVRARQQGGTS